MAEGSTPDYWKIVCDHRDKVRDLIKETDWVETKNKDGIRITYKDTDQGRMFRGETELNIPPATARLFLIPGSKGLRDKLQTNIKSFKIIKEEEKYFVAHEVLAGNMMISDRDVVCVYGGEDGCDFGSYIMAPSVEHPDYPASPQSKVVRATKRLAGFVLKRVDGDPNKCTLHAVMQMDMGGKVPASVVQSVQPKRMFEMFTNVKKGIADKLHEKN